MKTLDNQSMVLAFIAKNQESKANPTTAESISAGTGVFKLTVYKILKGLMDSKQVSIIEKSNPIEYVLANKPTKVKQDVISELKVSQEEKGESQEVFPKNKKAGRDTSKLKFMGKEYAKGPLVLAVVKHYCETHKTTMAKLKETFPDELQPRYGLIQLLNTAKKLSEGRDRFFLKPEQLIKIGEAKAAICNQWSSNNIGGFLKVAKKLGYTIK